MNASLTDILVQSGQAPDPFELFQSWFEEAAKSEINDPHAMTLATVDASGMPDARTVLMKGNDARGFVFYTNTTSAKGEELAQNPAAALLFHWKSLGRQVRVRGPVSLVDAAEADAYFASRPRGSQIGAWASDQSRPATDRAELQRRVDEREAEFAGTVPRPPHWTGYRVSPVQMEFWQNGEFRLHDRFVYRRAGDGPW
ncbi:MAG: pyridoxamine 5'-phosphate oxidase, partial [Pseudomonadota bacterium]